MKHIVKRAGHQEPFSPKKIYGSVYAACSALRMTTEEAELIAETVAAQLTRWVKDKREITSHQINQEVTKTMMIYSPDAAYLYDRHNDLC